MKVESIRTESDYEQALLRVEVLWDSPEDSAGRDELDMLAAVIEAYEREHYPSL